jgi:hypothetical protein
MFLGYRNSQCIEGATADINNILTREPFEKFRVDFLAEVKSNILEDEDVEKTVELKDLTDVSSEFYSDVKSMVI